jgi:hypothetical protein
MKNALLFFVFIILTSCGSEDINASKRKSLEGKWIWVQSSGGFAGKTETPESTNQVIYIEFSGNSLKKYVNGTLSADNTFVIKTQESIFGGKKSMIVSDNPDKYFVALSFEIEGNKLYLSEECYDCFGSKYERVK